jgi:hypothetical protein
MHSPEGFGAAHDSQLPLPDIKHLQTATMQGFWAASLCPGYVNLPGASCQLSPSIKGVDLFRRASRDLILYDFLHPEKRRTSPCEYGIVLSNETGVYLVQAGKPILEGIFPPARSLLSQAA